MDTKKKGHGLGKEIVDHPIVMAKRNPALYALSQKAAGGAMLRGNSLVSYRSTSLICLLRGLKLAESTW